MMLHTGACLRSVLVAVVGTCLGGAVGGTVGAEQAGAGGAGLGARVEALLRPFAETGNFSGVVLIARAGEVLVAKGYGLASAEWNQPNTTHTRFHIASVSKSFTAAAIMLLQQDGKLSVRDPVTRWVPDYPGGGRITIHHLLTHASGIPNVNDFPDYNERAKSPQTPRGLIDWFKDRPLEFEPGARYSYSNSNYNLLAYIIERASGLSYGEILRRRIFEPAGLHDTGHDGGPGLIIPERAEGYVPVGVTGYARAPFLDWSVKTGNGSLYSTAEDLLKWDRVLYTDRILSKASRDAMFTRHDSGVGYGWFVRPRFGRPSIAMNGRSPGFTSSLERYPDGEYVVIVLSNTYSAVAQELARDLAAVLFNEKTTVIPPAPQRQSPETLQRLAGRYRFGAEFFVPNVEATVEARGDHLVMTYAGTEPVPLVLEGGSVFLDRMYWSRVRFDVDASARGALMVMQAGDRQFPAVRVP